MTTNAEIESGVAYQLPRSREQREEGIVRMSMLALNSADRFRDIELTLEGLEATAVRGLAHAIKQVLRQDGYITVDGVDRALSDHLEALSDG